MILNLNIYLNGHNYLFGFLNDRITQRIEIENELIIVLYKIHNHKYCFESFFYKSKRICSKYYCNSKLKLYSAVQNLLQEELYHV